MKAQEIKREESIKKVMRIYKFAITFIIPIILLAIVGSVVTRNKPLPMKTTLLASGLANLVILGFVTNTFITLGIEYIQFKHMNDWSSGHKKEIYVIISKNVLLGIFNFFYLFFWTFIFADVFHWLAPNFFLQGKDFVWPIDWGGVALSCILAIALSIFMALLLAQYIKKYYVFGVVGLLYFLAFGYLAGGMFGPGATYWMTIPALLLPHAYIAHFCSGALTGGYYTVAHMPNIWDMLTLGGTTENINGVYSVTNENISYALEFVFGNPSGQLTDEQIRSIYVMQNNSIWDLSVFQLNQWSTGQLHFDGATIDPITITVPLPIGSYDVVINFPDIPAFDKSFRIYNSFYQISALNIFIPLAITIGCGTTWGYKFYIKK